MNTCKTCRHWKVKKENESYPSHMGILAPEDPDTYEPMLMPFEVKKCLNPKLLFCERPIESDGFSVADGSDYLANLITAENFGCVHHER